jgi:hypothetical protein
MSVEVPDHLQQQFILVISELRDVVGWEATKAYLSFFSHAAETNVSESNPRIQGFTQCVTDISSDASNPAVDPAVSSSSSAVENTDAALCERCELQEMQATPCP